MLLFPQKDASVKAAEKMFYVLSAREEVSTQLSQLLRQAGFGSIETLKQPAGQAIQLALPASTWGVIVDIASQQDAENVVLTIQAQIPRNIWCCVVGDSDSIALAQVFARNGIHYFNLHAQSEALVQAAAIRSVAKVERRMLSISVLACKGGVGNTSIAWQLVNRITQLRQITTLFVQGKSVSRDVDLLCGKKMSQEMIAINKHLDAMFWSEAGNLPLEQELFQKYNIVVFDDAIRVTDKEYLRLVVEGSSCVILTLDRSMCSVRTARQVIEINDAINRSQQTPRRLLLCLSDTRPVTPEMPRIEDLQSLLGCHIDVVFPWQKARPVTLFSAFRQKKTPMENLVQQVLGKVVPVKLPRKRWGKVKHQEA